MKNKNLITCDHIGILTNGYKRLVNFYIKKLGFEKMKEEILSKSIMKPIFGIASDCQFVRLASGDIKIEIFSPVNVALRKRQNHNVGYNHWALCVTDREKFFKKLRRAKVDIIQVKRNDHSVYFINDPDGNRIEIKEG